MNGIESMVRQMLYRPTTRDELRQHVGHLRHRMTQREVALELGISKTVVFNLYREFRERGRP